MRLIISDHENVAEFVASVRNCMDVKTLEVLKLNPFSRTEVSHMFLLTVLMCCGHCYRPGTQLCARPCRHTFIFLVSTKSALPPLVITNISN